MSYPRDLDEISTKELKAELDRRANCGLRNQCHYCKRPLKSEPSCKMVDAHNDKEE